MHRVNSILMQAPKMMIFETAANLELWPKILPHYRYIRFLERGHDRNVVIMAATRSGIPISWTSEQIIDRDKFEIHFHHLKAWTKGMRVVWTFSETPAWCARSDFTRFAVSASSACANHESDHRRFFHPQRR